VIKAKRLAGALSLALALLAISAPAASASQLTGPPLAVGHYTTIKVPGGNKVTPEGISDSGTIVGCDQRNAGERGFAEKSKKFTVLADPKAGQKGVTCALAINNHGAVVGNYGTRQFHGFIFSGTRFTTIDEPRAGHGIGQGTVAVGINDTGTIVGYYITPKNVQVGFVLRNAKFTSISFPGHRLIRQEGDRAAMR